MRIFNTLMVLFLCSACLFASQIELKFTPNQLSTDHKLYLDVQVRGTHDDFRLASQNFRFYYNAAALELDTEATQTTLDAAQYSDATFIKHFENVDASQVSQLSFDNHLGYANIAVRLLNNMTGGKTVTQEWTTIATIAFDIKDSKNIAVVWARDGKSDEYHTANVEIGEWISSREVAIANTTIYGDYVIENTSEIVSFDLKAYPNPTTDYIQVDINNTIDNATVQLISIDGAVVNTWEQRAATESYNLSHVPAGQYFLTVSNTNGQRDIKKIQVIK